MSQFGQNLGYVDELYRRYLHDPRSVSEAWREFFGGDQPASAQGEPVPPAASSPAEAPDGAEPLRGAAARLAENMTASLAVPVATSARTFPVKLLEENRRLLNAHQAAEASFKVSFTHLIAWAVVRALERHPAMSAVYTEVDGTPHRLPRRTIHLGLAVDLERRGERALLVPNIKDAGRLDFPAFVAAYDGAVARAREGKATVEDFQGTTVTLTNPGVVGTALSVPRLLEGQSAIVGVGSIAYPAAFAGAAPEMIAELGVSKVLTLTSTYDHRVIQGAESGAFLGTVERLLAGEEGFYHRIFTECGVPHEPFRTAPDRAARIGGAAPDSEIIRKQAAVLQLIRAYRVRGHLYAELDPLASGFTPEVEPELAMSTYGLTVWDLDRRFFVGNLRGSNATLTLRETLEILRGTYCGHIGVEFMHIPEGGIRAWLQERMEMPRPPLPRDVQLRILERLNVASAFERFLHTTYVGQKRFSLEGAETLIPMLDALLQDAADGGVEEVVLGMAHRGRLNVIAHVVGKGAAQIFREFEGELDPATVQGSGDVKYHLGAEGTFEAPSGRRLTVRLAANPSHLEAVDPVVEGMARARQDSLGDTAHERVLPVLLHGDAAFAGQGVVVETLNLSELRGYRTGGTVHVVVNNQIGFTTGPADARSSLYATDVAKAVRAPIFHVNADVPEDAVRVIRLALAFRQRFKRDVVVDLVCYRRWGHNEGDDPSYTAPLLYAKIEKRRPVRVLYTEQLLRRGVLDMTEAEAELESFRRHLQQVLQDVQSAQAEPPQSPMEEAASASEPDTFVSPAVLDAVLEGMERLPEGFQVHPKLARQLSRRRERMESGSIDWALAEALSLGSLVLEGGHVRLSGEDTARGTFSQRHATLYDYRTGAATTPLARLPGSGSFHVFDSHLSEFAALGFEYGYSVARPEALVLWEAQFGDFVNGAQVILDQFLFSAESKWGQRSALVLLLPHGQEGQGPEHSSARLERFLQACARDNLRVCYPSTPAQYFHLLRRQALLSLRKPLVVMTPKSLLRLPAAVSSAEELHGGRFRQVLDDARVRPEAVRRLLLCTGKIAYELMESAGVREDVAVVRLEQLYPFPGEELARILARYGEAETVWVQEEPRNMGAFAFVREHLDRPLRYVGRPPSPSPATGSSRRHVASQKQLLEEALGAPAPAVR
ncbi:MAG TPA: multifunctional oxoglutarate decarboxylase/oxoglutarate dehydrogenase thiamine pyrophosphate-binding subunit/dihydrolipoyllysine-residue succinyltransferase subunit [Candidatus Polarisedimenticolaceae bacterium]|nr:multifunctional oxoglutarate decarboxylase/oxoglutarate dehydrogenase thiamine pyrophosphate-binding subunit/dihydrolipoyllysine-residue succinyltransferase subunit [Candidatus Polarisedimenticolaceae bacterium]